MKRFEMIKDKDYFSNVIKNGRYLKDTNFVIYYIDNNDADYSHFGIAIKKSIGKAHIRNRIKRQVREIITNNKNLFNLSQDYIIMIRDGCIKSNFRDKERSIITLMKGDYNEKK